MSTKLIYYLTVTLHLRFFPFTLTVIVVFPGFLALTLPKIFTVATVELLLLYFAKGANSASFMVAKEPYEYNGEKIYPIITAKPYKIL